MPPPVVQIPEIPNHIFSTVALMIVDFKIALV